MMSRRDWWLGIAAIALAIGLHALLPRYEWRDPGGEGQTYLRFDRWTGRGELGQFTHIEGRGRRHLISKNPIPLREDQIARNHDRASLVAFGEEREENLGLFGALLDVAHIVEEQHREVIELAQGERRVDSRIGESRVPGTVRQEVRDRIDAPDPMDPSKERPSEEQSMNNQLKREEAK